MPAVHCPAVLLNPCSAVSGYCCCMPRLGVGSEDPHRRSTLCALMKGTGGLAEVVPEHNGQQHNHRIGNGGGNTS
jgi:hypothetical protein